MDYDGEDSVWSDTSRIGSEYEEQVNCKDGSYRHRLRFMKDGAALPIDNPWFYGRAPGSPMVKAYEWERPKCR